MARAGLYRQQVTLVFPAPSTPDGMGGWLPDGEARQVSVWARVRQLKGGQLLALGKELNAEVFQLTCRYRADLAGVDQVVWDNRWMKVISQATDERSTEMALLLADVR